MIAVVFPKTSFLVNLLPQELVSLMFSWISRCSALLCLVTMEWELVPKLVLLLLMAL